MPDGKTPTLRFRPSALIGIKSKVIATRR